MFRTLGFCVLFLLVFPVGSGSSPSPQEDYTSGSWLLVSCELAVRSDDDKAFQENNFESYRNGFCRGIVDGVSDVSPKVCQPQGSTYGQYHRVVLKYLQDHPEELHLRNSELVEKALAKAFPCQR